MDFKDLCKQLSERIVGLKEQIATEEATKNAFIMPFIQMLGYDVFNPTEVVPEMNCDLVKKKGEKIDYAIMKDGEPIMLIECKHWKQDLNLHDTQLQKYYVASKAKFGVLTNGVVYRFYTDLAKPNIMDSAPFLEVNMEDLKETQVDELKKFHKSYFDVDNIMSTANELKYISELKAIVKSEFSNPSADFVRMLTKRVYEGAITQKVFDQFSELVKRTIGSYVNDVISERLNVAIKSTEEPRASKPAQAAEEPNAAETQADNKNLIVTTEEELEGFYIVKSIARTVLAAERVTYRDAVSYFAIFADDNNRRPICRLHFNTATKYLETFNENKEGTKHKLASLDEIYSHQEEIKAMAAIYVDMPH